LAWSLLRSSGKIKETAMDATNDEQTEILKNIWQQMVAMNRRIDTTNTRLDAMNENLSNKIETLTGRVDTLTTRVDTLTGRVDAMSDRMQDNFSRIQRNFERYADLDSRLVRVEQHIGLR
jgi:chaperonin cofactor prefoldin